MGGFFGITSKQSCLDDVFFGVDYHSHLGTRRGGLAAYDKTIGLQRVIHNIENSPFRTKFEHVLEEMTDEEEYEPVDASYFFGETATQACLNPIMFPDKTTIERCAMLHDTDTDALLRMWSRVKGSNASAWTYIVIILVLGGLIFAVAFKYYRKNSRKRKYSRKK